MSHSHFPHVSSLVKFSCVYPSFIISTKDMLTCLPTQVTCGFFVALLNSVNRANMHRFQRNKSHYASDLIRKFLDPRSLPRRSQFRKSRRNSGRSSKCIGRAKPTCKLRIDASGIFEGIERKHYSRGSTCYNRDLRYYSLGD